jgi:hypothetical protein
MHSYKLISLSVFFFGFCFAFAEPKEKQIIVSPASYDFGVIKDDKLISHIFTMKNMGEQSVTLTALPSSCGCMLSKPEPSVLKPGEEGRFKILFQPKGMRGAFQWDASLQTSLTEQPVIVVPLKAYVLRDGILSDEIINFRVFKRGEEKEITLWMVYRHNPQFKVVNARLNVDGFDLKCQEMKEVEGFYPGLQRGYRIDIRAKKDIPYGRNDGRLILETDIPEHKKIELRLFAYAIGDLTAAPDYLSFGVIPKYFFSLPATYQDTLDKGKLPEEMLKAFQKEEITLSENVSLHIIAKESQWRIQDAKNGLQYFVMKDKDSLKIYEEISKRQITVSHNHYEKFRITQVKSNVPFISTKLEAVIPEKYYYIHVILKCPENAPKGEFRGILDIYTDCPTHSHIPVQLQGLFKTRN